jgi:hypothetical protein
MNAKKSALQSGVKIVLIIAMVIPKLVQAQGTLNALTTSANGTTIGSTLDGVGWSFVPSSDLFVTAINSTAPQVNFWLGTNQIIATYNYAGPYFSGGGASAPTNFQDVTTLLLSAGQTYYISTQQTNFSSQVFTCVYGLTNSESIYGPRSFVISPYITEFSSYNLSADGTWSPTPPSDNVDFVVLGPNFQFQVVPEPTSLEYSLLAYGAWLIRRRRI